MGYIDLTGRRFGKLVVIEKTELRASNGGVIWRCKCDCGNETTTASKNLLSGNSKSCGCRNYETKNAKHGLSGKKIYSVWDAMMSRCYNINQKSYKDYGARGVSVCDEWHDPKAFVEWSKVSGYKEGLSIDRIDVNGKYEPSNCRWATRIEQANNKRSSHLITYNGKTQTVKQWANEIGIKYQTLLMRLNERGWSVEKALTEQVHKGTK